MGRLIGAAWEAAKSAGAAVARDLWPTWQAGLQDAQALATRMTLDAPAGASVPGQAGVSTQRELYEIGHAEPAGPEPAAGHEAAGPAAPAAGFEQYVEQQAQRGREPGPERGLEAGR